MIMSLQQIKQMEDMLEEARVFKKAVEEKADVIAGLSPRLTEEDRKLINEKIDKIKVYNQYTFEFQKELKRAGHSNEDNIRTVGDYSYDDAFEANRNAFYLKQGIRKMLEKYKHFDHYFPIPGTTQLKREPVKLPYRKIDPEVSKIEKELESLRSHTEEEVYQLKKRGVNMNYYLGINKED